MEGAARHEELRRGQRLFSEDIKPAPIRQIHLPPPHSVLAAAIRDSSRPMMTCTVPLVFGEGTTGNSFPGGFNLRIIFSETAFFAFYLHTCNVVFDFPNEIAPFICRLQH